MLTGNWLEIHSNAEFAKTALYGQRLVQGSLVFSIVNALIPFDSTVVEAFYVSSSQVLSVTRFGRDPRSPHCGLKRMGPVWQQWN
ncbi:MAG: MaoC/PaaZ C-terminal domain-containing protein [Alphaproteobacteria bacterium]|nr:MaoC/PaaZ C-terminal domain-containing protein [Alphaproteobacteria bacterium]